MVRATLFVDPSLDIFRQLHCLVAFSMSASQGFVASVVSPCPNVSVTAPSGANVAAETLTPAREASRSALASVGFRCRRRAGRRSTAEPSTTAIDPMIGGKDLPASSELILILREKLGAKPRL
jgi:hypothetical protein